MDKTPTSNEDNEASNDDHQGTLPGTLPGTLLRTLQRRSFLQASLAGAVAATLPTACTSAEAVSAATAATASTQTENPSEAALATPPAINTETAFDNWNNTWVWRVSDWPGQQLDLQVVENQNPGINVGLGNPGSVIFSYGGNTPAPTIRMRGDEILFVKLRNFLGENLGQTPVGPFADPAALTPWLGKSVCEKAAQNPNNGIKQADPYDAAKARCNLEDGPGGQKRTATVAAFPEAVYSQVPADVRSDFCLGEHTNGLHAAHTTNLHTHGLHVRPDRNPNGTHSDNVILRVMPQKDLLRREQNAEHASCEWLKDKEQIYFLQDDETVGEADYEFRLGDVMGDPDQPQPPGTHWYHPHCHGATHNQVSSGMAGFLIVEGDVDDAVNKFFTGQTRPDPELKTGPYDYRERLMLMQRVNVANESVDPNSPRPSVRRPTVLPLVNGSNNAPTIRLRPGAVERWRILNGSVDGRGYKHVMVLEGQYNVVTIPGQNGAPSHDQLYSIAPGGQATPVSLAQIEPYGSAGPKQALQQLAFDGVTLVSEAGNYTVKDLAQQNAGTENPLARPLSGNPNTARLSNLQSVFENGASIINTWVRPNEVYLGPANRTDVFFRAPYILSHNYQTQPKIYTVVAIAAVIHADTPLQNLQKAVQAGIPTAIPGPTDIILAHIIVAGEPVPNSSGYVLDELIQALPPCPPYLKPVADNELELTTTEKAVKPQADNYRTRTVRYSGIGAQGFPLVKVPTAQADRFPDLNKLAYATSPNEGSPTKVYMSPNIRTMAINGRKFNPNDPKRPKAYVIMDEQTAPGTHAAEEWALFNESMTLWGNTVDTPVGERGQEPQGDPKSAQYKQPDYQWAAHYVSYPINRRQGAQLFADNHHFQAVTRAIDHPFHQHQNPFWVMRIEIPDQDGNLVNILDAPRWQDVVWIPRNGGRIVFRSRFPDFVGTWVNHCHILLHEDNGMMQTVQGTPFASEADYTTANTVAKGGLTPPAATNVLYPPPTLEQMYRRNLAFVDSNPSTGQMFPLPSYFDDDENLIESMIPVPELP